MPREALETPGSRVMALIAFAIALTALLRSRSDSPDVDLREVAPVVEEGVPVCE